MHKVRSTSQSLAPSAILAPRANRSTWRKPALLGAAGALLVILIAWFDGGEEPIHAIAESVATPSEGGA